jgi:hypothetical protein
MCGPALVLGLIGAGVQAAAAGHQADAQARAERIQAMQAQQQSELQNRQANNEATAGQFQEARKREQAAKLSSQQRTLVGGSGFTMGGSPTDVVIDSRQGAELDASALRYGTKIKQDNLLYQSGVSQWNRDRHYEAADEKQQAGVFGAISPFLGLATKLGGSFGSGG